jgi:UDP-N-acetylmuramate: L-alanyl-gamma-D-glutamyl-meso-diaminopimelate ligase
MPQVASLPSPLSSVHIMGIGGTAMAALAGMLVDEGVKITGSDKGVYPPMSDYLGELGIDVRIGYEAKNLEHHPDLVVVGNVIRAEYEEAQALLASDLPYTSFPHFLGERFLQGTKNVVVAGTHGKTTTTALAAWLLESVGRAPGFLIGGRAANFDRTARAAKGGIFVIEGDEYDTAFFDKGPKFLHYKPTTAIVTSIELDHVDIFADVDAVSVAFRALAAILPSDGHLVARTDDPRVKEIADAATCTVHRYGRGEHWDGRIDDVDTTTGRMHFTVLNLGKPVGKFESSLVGEHNLMNQVAVVAALAIEGHEPASLVQGFKSFGGIKRRQEVIGEPGGVTVVDDFAHHPTAVRVTLDALRMRFGRRRLWAIFEPRTNTSRRNVFQQQYAESFDAADVIVLAPPVDLERIAEGERFDIDLLMRDLRARGKEAFVWGRTIGSEAESNAIADAISSGVAANVLPEDVVAVLSNGAFGGLHDKLIRRLESRFVPPLREDP